MVRERFRKGRKERARHGLRDMRVAMGHLDAGPKGTMGRHFLLEMVAMMGTITSHYLLRIASTR